MKTEEIGRVLWDAENAFNQGDVKAAQGQYEQILESDPNNEKAKAGLKKIQSRQKEVETLKEIIQEGDTAFEKERYSDAKTAYNRALGQGASKRIFDFHTALEKKIQLTNALEDWTEKVESVTSSRRPDDQQPPGELLQTITRLLNELPRNHDHYSSLESTLNETRQQIEQELDDLQRTDQIRDAFENQDYEGVIRLCETFPSRSPLAAQVQGMLERARDRLEKHIRPAIKRARTAYEDSHWQESLNTLASLQDDYPNCPEWKTLWNEVHLGKGQQAMEEGKDFNTGREFDRASQSFTEAKKSFTVIQGASPGHHHPTAQRMIRETDDLLRITSYQQQARAAWDKHDLDNAIGHLKQADQYIASVEQSRDLRFPTISAAIDGMRQELEREKEQIEEDTRNLREAGRLLESKRLDEAKERFAGIKENELYPNVREQAAQGLRQAEEAIGRYEAASEKGGKSSTPAEAVKAFQSAYDCWPYHPEAQKKLEAALVKAGQEARNKQENKQAAFYFNRVLEINPANPDARRGKEEIGAEDEIGAIIKDVQAKLKTLEQQETLSATNFASLLKQLEEVHQKAAPYDTLRHQVEEIQKTIQTRQEQWQQSEDLVRQAREQREAGRWNEAVKSLEQALRSLEPEVPRTLQEERQRWRTAQQAVQEAEASTKATLEQARNAYEQAVSLDEFNTVLEHLKQANQALSFARDKASYAGGRIGPSLDDLENQGTSLMRRATIAHESLQADPEDGIVHVRTALERLKPETDPVLQRLEKQFDYRIRNERIPKLMAQARQQRDAGKTEQALDLLRNITLLYPDHPDATQFFNEILHRRKIDDILQQVEADVQSRKTTNSHADAVEARRSGLGRLLQDVTLPQEAHTILQKLLLLRDEVPDPDPSGANPIGFANPELWEKVRDLQKQLSMIQEPTGVLSRVALAANKWVEEQQDLDRRGFITSLEQLGDYEEAYEKAKREILRRPDDPEIFKMLQDNAERIRSRANDSAKKRLGRARNLLNQGYADAALDNLRGIEEFYRPIEEKFPELINGMGDIEDIRAKAEEYRLEAENLRVIYEEMTPVLEEAERHYVSEELEKARQTLLRLRGDALNQAPNLKKRAEGLDQAIKEAHNQNNQRTIREALIKAKTNLQMAKTHEDLQNIFNALTGMGVSWDVVSPEDKQEYYEVIGEINACLTSLEAGETYKNQADDAHKQGDYEKEAASLEKAIEQTHNVTEKIELEIRLEEVQKLAEEKQAIREALETGKTKLGQGEYDEARIEFRRARDLGGNVGNFLAIVQAGIFLKEARKVWKEEARLDNAKSNLDEARSILADVSEEESQNLRREIELFRRTMEQTHTIKVAIQDILMDVRSLLARGELDNAKKKLREAQEKAPDNPEVKELLQEIEKNSHVQGLVSQAREARKDNKYQKALDLVEEALKIIPSHKDAKDMKRQLEEGQKASSKLQEVERLIHQKEFPKARQSLAEAELAGAIAEEIRTTRKKLDDEEQEWHTSLFNPIGHALVDENYSVAFERCKQALAHSEKLTIEFATKLKERRQTIVRDWVEKVTNDAQAGLQEATGEDDFQGISLALDEFLKQNLPLTPQQKQQIERLLRQVREKRIDAQLEEVERLCRDRNLKRALEQVNKAETEAKEVGLVQLEDRAITLKFDIEMKIREQEEAVQQQERSNLLDQARSMFEAARNRANLEKASDYIQDALKIEVISNDDAIQFKNEIDKAIALFNKTRSTIDETIEQIQKRQFENAHRKIRSLSQVSPILRDEYTNQRTLAEALYEADQCQYQQEWKKALERYRQTLEKDPALEPLLELDLKRCREKLTSDIVEQVQALLEKEDPQLEKAKTILSDAEASDWLIPTTDNTIIRLRASIRIRENLGQAITILTSEDGDVEQALRLLNDASHLVSDTDETMPTRINQWATLARSIQAEQKGDLDMAEAEFEKLQQPVANEKRARQLHRTIVQARIEEQIKQIEQALQGDDLYRAEQAWQQAKNHVGEGHDSRLETWQQKIHEHQAMQQRIKQRLGEARTHESNGQWKEAIETIQKAEREAIPSYPPVVAAATALQNNLVEHAERSRAIEQFTQAIEFCTQALKLGDRTDIIARRRELTNEREKLRTDLQQEIRETLERWDLDRAQTLLNRGLAVDPEDFTFTNYSTRLKGMKSQYTALRETMQGGWRAFQQGQYEEASQQFTKALEIDTSFQEADLWQRYTKMMVEGYKEFEEERFSQATTLLESATVLLRVERNKPLSAILGSEGELRRLRFQAVFHASQLAEIADAIKRLDEQYWYHKTRDNRIQTNEIIHQLSQEQDKFKERYRVPGSPPPDFNGWQESGTSQPSHTSTVSLDGQETGAATSKKYQPTETGRTEETATVIPSERKREMTEEDTREMTEDDEDEEDTGREMTEDDEDMVMDKEPARTEPLASSGPEEPLPEPDLSYIKTDPFASSVGGEGENKESTNQTTSPSPSPPPKRKPEPEHPAHPTAQTEHSQPETATSSPNQKPTPGQSDKKTDASSAGKTEKQEEKPEEEGKDDSSSKKPSSPWGMGMDGFEVPTYND